MRRSTDRGQRAGRTAVVDQHGVQPTANSTKYSRALRTGPTRSGSLRSNTSIRRVRPPSTGISTTAAAGRMPADCGYPPTLSTRPRAAAPTVARTAGRGGARPPVGSSLPIGTGRSAERRRGRPSARVGLPRVDRVAAGGRPRRGGSPRHLARRRRRHRPPGAAGAGGARDLARTRGTGVGTGRRPPPAAPRARRALPRPTAVRTPRPGGRGRRAGSATARARRPRPAPPRAARERPRGPRPARRPPARAPRPAPPPSPGAAARSPAARAPPPPPPASGTGHALGQRRRLELGRVDLGSGVAGASRGPAPRGVAAAGVTAIGTGGWGPPPSRPRRASAPPPATLAAGSAAPGPRAPRRRLGRDRRDGLAHLLVRDLRVSVRRAPPRPPQARLDTSGAWPARRGRSPGRSAPARRGEVNARIAKQQSETWSVPESSAARRRSASAHHAGGAAR